MSRKKLQAEGCFIMLAKKSRYTQKELWQGEIEVLPCGRRQAKTHKRNGSMWPAPHMLPHLYIGAGFCYTDNLVHQLFRSSHSTAPRPTAHDPVHHPVTSDLRSHSSRCSLMMQSLHAIIRRQQKNATTRSTRHNDATRQQCNNQSSIL